MLETEIELQLRAQIPVGAGPVDLVKVGGGLVEGQTEGLLEGQGAPPLNEAFKAATFLVSGRTRLVIFSVR